jgi:hypothetical protein
VEKSEKVGFYKEELKTEEHIECVMGGDWNVILRKEETSGVFKNRGEVSAFREFCNRMEV